MFIASVNSRLLTLKKSFKAKKHGWSNSKFTKMFLSDSIQTHAYMESTVFCSFDDVCPKMCPLSCLSTVGQLTEECWPTIG